VRITRYPEKRSTTIDCANKGKEGSFAGVEKSLCLSGILSKERERRKEGFSRCILQGGFMIEYWRRNGNSVRTNKNLWVFRRAIEDEGDPAASLKEARKKMQFRWPGFNRATLWENVGTKRCYSSKEKLTKIPRVTVSRRTNRKVREFLGFSKEPIPVRPRATAKSKRRRSTSEVKKMSVQRDHQKKRNKGQFGQS